jgi:hypothetical protein
MTPCAPLHGPGETPVSFGQASNKVPALAEQRSWRTIGEVVRGLLVRWGLASLIEANATPEQIAAAERRAMNKPRLRPPKA